MTPNALRWMDVSLPEPAANLQLDEQLLMDGAGVFRVWESPGECVVLGQSGHAEREVYVSSGVPVLRRCSGGGAVVLGPGCLSYSVILPFQLDPRWRDVAFSFLWVMQKLQTALALPGLRMAGHCDLALHGRKVSGNAQRRGRHAFLHHGTLLYDFDVSRVDRLLRMPLRRPAYRADRTHSEFLTNLPLSALDLKQRLAEAWC